jgi:thiamine-phosphate pyrophosphorylase
LKLISQSFLYGILDMSYVERKHALSVAAQMIEGGIDIVQLRAKNFATADIGTVASDVRSITREARVPLIINDHPELVPLSGADGVHVGQDDAPVAKAREIATSSGTAAPLVGKSTHSIEQAIAAEAEGADYIGFGPLFSTPTKPDYKPIGLTQIRAVHERVRLPVFCIGGIKLENLASVIAAGARRVVMVSGILLAPEISSYVREARAMLENSV